MKINLFYNDNLDNDIKRRSLNMIMCKNWKIVKLGTTRVYMYAVNDVFFI